MNFKKAFGLLMVVAVVFLAVADMPLLAADNNSAPESNCPKKAPVVIETVKTAVFIEFQFSGQGQAEVVAVKSPVSGLISEIGVSEGSLVDVGQGLVVLNAGQNEEIKKLTADVAQAKKILTARQNWKEKSEQAIQSATKAYQKVLELLNQKKAQANQVVQAPVAGIVHLVQAVGSEIVADALLLEISNPRQMQFQISLTDSDKGLLSVGDKFVGTAENVSKEVAAEVIAVSTSQAVFAVNNSDNQVKEGITFTFKKLQAEHADAIVIPTAAIQKDSLGHFVYVAEKKKAKKLYITMGRTRAGKTMILKGLETDTPLIVSGLECLVDGKAIRIVNKEELAAEKAEAKVKEDKKAEAKEAKIAIEPETKTKVSEEAEKIAKTAKHPITVGLVFERFTINDKNMREYYSNWFQHIPGLEVSYQVIEKIDVWASAKYYSDKQTTVFYEDTVRFTLIPFSLGARFRPAKMGAFEPFIGAGFNVYYYAETIKGESELENTTGLAIGFHFQGGTYFHFSPSFLKGIFAKHNRSLLGEIFLKYNIVNKTLAEMLPDGTDKLDLGGMEMGIGLAVKF